MLSAQKLLESHVEVCWHVLVERVLHDRVLRIGASVAVQAEMLLRSPRKLFSFIIKKCIYRRKVSYKKYHLILKKTSLIGALVSLF